jgi:uncharacterized protein
MSSACRSVGGVAAAACPKKQSRPQEQARRLVPWDNVGMNTSSDSDDSDDSGADPTISCASCEACCCRLEVMLMGEDDPPVQLTAQDRWGGWVMRRLEDGWCIAVDRETMRCTIYERRPTVCRDYETGASECIIERRQLLGRRPVSAIRS